MLLACDCHYEADTATTAGLLFVEWTAAQPERVLTRVSTGIAGYEPGSFYLRELPLLTALIDSIEPALPLEAVVIDGYVELDANGRPGLGAHLYSALDHRVPIIGVAKNPFAGSAHATQLLRGASRRPLYVTSAGIPVAEAAERVASMHGPHRMPTLLQLVDAASRGH